MNLVKQFLEKLLELYKVHYKWDAGNDSITIEYFILNPKANTDLDINFTKIYSLYELVDIFKSLNLTINSRDILRNCNPIILYEAASFCLYCHNEPGFKIPEEFTNMDLFAYKNNLSKPFSSGTEDNYKILKLIANTIPTIDTNDLFTTLAGLCILEEIKSNIINTLNLPSTSDNYYEIGEGDLILANHNLFIAYNNKKINDEFIVHYIVDVLPKKLLNKFITNIEEYYNHIINQIPTKFKTVNKIIINIEDEEAYYESTIGYYRPVFKLNDSIKPLVSFIKQANGTNTLTKISDFINFKLEFSNKTEITLMIETVEIIKNNKFELNLFYKNNEQIVFTMLNNMNCLKLLKTLK